MSEMVKCFVMHGIGKVGMMEKPVPRPGPGDAIIRTTAALISTSDTHTVAGAIGDRHGLTLGHEAVGVIHELGEIAAASGLFKDIEMAFKMMQTKEDGMIKPLITFV